MPELCKSARPYGLEKVQYALRLKVGRVPVISQLSLQEL
jgi:hypothetical protein